MTHSIDNILSDWPLDSTVLSFDHEDISSSDYCSTHRVTPLTSTPNNKHHSYIVKYLKPISDKDKSAYFPYFYQSNFHQSVQTQKALTNIGITPEILYYCEKSSVCIMPYLENTPFEDLSKLSQKEKQREIALQHISQQLQTLHNYNADKLHTPCINTPWTPSSTHIQHYAKAIKKQLSPDMHQELNDFLSMTQSHIDAFDNDPTPKVLCHNDLNTGNILIQKQKVLLIDWEFAALNNPWFDIASLGYYLKLSHDETKHLAQQCLNIRPERHSEENSYHNALITVITIDILWNIYISKQANQSWQRLAPQRLKLRSLLNNTVY